MTDTDSKTARAAWVRALARTATIEREPTTTLPVIIDRLGSDFGTATALVAADATMSYRDLAARARRYSRWGRARGLRRGAVVALWMPNRAEYLCIWLGLTRIGVTVALLNTQLTGPVLAHSIHIVAPEHLIVDSSLAPALEAGTQPLIPPSVTVWVSGTSHKHFAPLEAAVAEHSDAPLEQSDDEAPTLDATALYIFTSGTTGLPKAAKVSHYRVMQWSHWFAGMMNIGREDRMYDCLPLYHSVGGVVAAGATLVGGGALVIRARFSASDFWRDVHAERCTLFQYIGELCRYLVNAPPHPLETQHNLRLACGNGLRPEIWETFKTRFAIPRILEYYASTEGNFSLYNCEGEPGSIGRIPPFLAQRLPVALLRFDVESEAPMRNAAGFCERTAASEVGEAVGQIPQGDAVVGRFEGYADEAATARKVLRNVFEPGDAWYRTGDLMRRDERGFYYFMDRIGDTYRWKGENVSTAEVQSALSACRGVLESVVFGVAIPGADGRAGLAALVVAEDFDLAQFRRDVAQRLPTYARPLFVRLLRTLEATGTFKPRKQDLIGEGFDPEKIRDPLYVDDPRAQRYVPLDAVRHAAIVSGRVR
jgi:fatty-acyl-CoA synthase